jgi:DNA-binding transcriptional ArsR family regulator
MSLLPSSGPRVSPTQEGELQVVGIESEEMETVVDALASDTARDLLAEIYEDPAVPSELAERLDMTLQRVSYHLDKLEEASMIRVAGTRYSEKGQEMKIYAPADEPLVVFVGTEERKSSFIDLLKRLIPAIAILGVFSYATQVIIENLRTTPDGLGPGGEPVPVEPIVAPGVLVFLGGLLVIGLSIGWWIRRNHR